MSAPICNTAWFQEWGRQVRARMVQEGKLCSHLSVLYQHQHVSASFGEGLNIAEGGVILVLFGLVCQLRESMIC